MLSRSGHSTGAKLTRRLDIPVSEELEEGIIAMAAMHGMPKAEFVRNWLERGVFGELSMMRRLARAMGTRPLDESPTNGRD